jgi:hypothetical protein
MLGPKPSAAKLWDLPCKEAVANLHSLNYAFGAKQGKIVEDVEGVNRVPPSRPVLGRKRRRHDTPAGMLQNERCQMRWGQIK